MLDSAPPFETGGHRASRAPVSSVSNTLFSPQPVFYFVFPKGPRTRRLRRKLKGELEDKVY